MTRSVTWKVTEVTVGQDPFHGVFRVEVDRTAFVLTKELGIITFTVDLPESLLLLST